MTCIVAIGNMVDVQMGADGIHHNDNDQSLRLKEPKIFIRKFDHVEILIGVSGSTIIQQLIQKEWNPDEELFTDPDDTMSEKMWNIRTHLWGFLHKHEYRRTVCDEVKDLINGEIIFGFEGYVWSMASDGALGQHKTNYHAIGAGDELALGSLYTSAPPEGVAETDNEITERIKIALSAASFHLSSIQGPFTFLKC